MQKQILDTLEKLALDFPKPSDVEEVIYMNPADFQIAFPEVESLDGNEFAGIKIILHDFIPRGKAYKTNECCFWNPKETSKDELNLSLIQESRLSMYNPSGSFFVAPPSS